MLYRTILLTGIAWASLTVILLAFLITLSWFDVQRLMPLQRHVTYRVKLDTVRSVLAERFILQNDEVSAQDKQFISDTTDALETLASSNDAFSKKSTAFIRKAVAALRGTAVVGPDSETDQTTRALKQALIQVRKALKAEDAAHEVSLSKLTDYGRRQHMTSIVLAVVIVLATVVSVIIYRKRVLAPLRDLTYLMGLLARKDYVAAMTDKIDPLMTPLFAKYNHMVRRMRNLEAGHLKREEALQQDVDQVTRALVQQQAALGQAERMAAVGDVAARLAHDLRNPLTGILMGLTILREEIDSAEQGERLDLVIAELDRIARLLNELVDESRQFPEPPQRLQLSRVVDDMIKLLRYQLDDGIVVNGSVPKDIYCRLPDSAFRHVLLNLMTNAAQAIGERPGKIEITAARKENQVELTISDNGPGFPKELLNAGVHEYGSWRKGGTGIGLAAVRRFTLAHGSRFELKNTEGGGATVVLLLPVEDCDQ